MIGLLDVELRRAFARRLVRFTAALMLLGIVIAAVVVFFRSGDVPPETRHIVHAPPEVIEDCVENPEHFIAPGEPGVEDPDASTRERCMAMFTSFDVRDKRFHLTSLYQTFEGFVVPLTILAWLLGASLVGAEWRAGTMTTVLTWETRRIRLMAAKALAAVVIGILFFVGFNVVLGVALWPSAVFRGTTAGFDFADTAGLVLRGSLLAGVGTMIGFALGSLGRNTTMAMAAGFIYLAVLEGGLIGGFFPGIRRWLIVGNSIVLMTGSNPDIAGRSRGGAVTLLLIYGIGAVALATAAFRARDVT